MIPVDEAGLSKGKGVTAWKWPAIAFERAVELFEGNKALYGDNWAESGSSVALRIPSALSPVEFNYLLNPSHPEIFDLMKTVQKIPYQFDTRLK